MKINIKPIKITKKNFSKEPKRVKVRLLEDGYITSSRIWPNYRSLWKALVN